MTDEQQPENPIDVEKTVEVVSPPTLSAQPERPKKKVPVMLIIIASIVVIGAVVAWFFRGTIIDTLAGKLTVDESATDTSDASQQTAITDPELKKFITPTTGESWYATPKSMAPQGWFKGELASTYTAVDGLSVQEQIKQNAPAYAEVGTRAGGVIVLVKDPYSGGMAEAYWLLEKRADGTIALIVRPQSTSEYDSDQLKYAKDSVSSKVTVFDESTHYDSLSLPASIDIGNKEVVTRPHYTTLLQSWGLSLQSGTTTKQVKQLGSSRLMRVETTYSDTQLTNIGYYIATPIGTQIGVEYNPNATSLEKYTFTNGANLQYKDATGKMVYDTIAPIARGCGGALAAVTRSDALKLNQLTKIGTTDAGRAVYEVTDKNASLYVKGYKEYQEAYATDAVSFDEYVKQHGLMVIQNSAGELLVYIRGQYAMVGGCAKPVIYLYPTATAAVSVRVGANVTKSDPSYPMNGWTNVVARPDGMLSYGGKQYTSLFWEGTGSGSYPGIVSGVVVKHSEAIKTIREQLVQQGLNVQEIADFMAFWTDKIPASPYVRLTWLTTEQMNDLAPLTITPKPNTLIRVFLDMGGLDKPISLPAQQLSSVKRTGFTVVEWGGLTSEISQ